MMFSPAKSLLLLACLAALVGCDSRSEKRTTLAQKLANPALKDSYRAPVLSAEVSEVWSPENVILECAAGTCPAQVGLLIFVQPSRPGFVNVNRCTAFLIRSDAIMSNSHCDYSNNREGFFVTQMKGANHFRRIKNVSFRKFTAGVGESHSGRPDAAIFELESALPLQPLQLAKAGDPHPEQLVAYVVNDGAAAKPGEPTQSYILERRECQLRRHEFIFPFDVDENPDVLMAFGCKTQGGNSGSPLFAKGSWRVEAVYFGSQDPAEVAILTRKNSGREPFHFEKDWVYMATNVRCLELPGYLPSECLEVTPQQANARFNRLVESTLAGFQTRRAGLKGNAFELVGNTPPTTSYEIFYRPKCVRSEARELDYIFEVAELSFSRWAEPIVTFSSEQVAHAKILRRKGREATVQVDWPNYSGRLKYPQNDVRKAWGSRFSIELERCSS